jgi:hypothetical protein
MDGKDDDDMDAVLNKEREPGKPKGKASTHKHLITRNLRMAYGEIASEPVPDRFLELLNKIDELEDKSS